MTTNTFQQESIQKIKWLTQALIISATLNVGLFATFVYFVLKDSNASVALEHKPASNHPIDAPSTNQELLRSYANLGFQDLLLRLENKELAEDGYTKRDLALSTLVAFHHFNLERALGGLVLQQRKIMFTGQEGQEKVDLTIFPGLADYQYQAILHYAKTERWPFTSQGLFYEVKRSHAPRDPTLLEAFYLTPEFHSFFTLFTRSGLALDKEQLVQMLADGEWKILHDFTEQQKQAQDLSAHRRRSLLLAYLNYKSKVAAQLLLETDMEFALKRFDDAQVMLFLEILTDRTPQLETFAKDLLSSPRNDDVHKKAALKLYSFAGEPLPEPYDHQAALQKFSPQFASRGPAKKSASAAKSAPVAAAPKSPTKSAAKTTTTSNRPRRTHTVQKGDTLCKIARRYNVSVNAIMRQNHLESERLKVGKTLEIP
jgi:LysM repeat protein